MGDPAGSLNDPSDVRTRAFMLSRRQVRRILMARRLQESSRIGTSTFPWRTSEASWSRTTIGVDVRGVKY